MRGQAPLTTGPAALAHRLARNLRLALALVPHSQLLQARASTTGARSSLWWSWLFHRHIAGPSALSLRARSHALSRRRRRCPAGVHAHTNDGRRLATTTTSWFGIPGARYVAFCANLATCPIRSLGCPPVDALRPSPSGHPHCRVQRQALGVSVWRLESQTSR